MPAFRFFSQRHAEALEKKSLKPSFSERLRRSMLRVLQEYRWQPDEWGNAEDKWKAAENAWLRSTGEESLYAYERAERGSVRRPAEFEGVILRGWPAHTMDMVEALLPVLPEDEAGRCEREVNEVLEVHNSEWRLAGGRFWRADEGYLAAEVAATADSLLAGRAFEGARQELAQSRSALTDGDTNAAVVEAGKALESAIKCVLATERGRPGELIRALVDSGVMPDYYKGFLQAFEQILVAVVKERSEPGRAHGAGKEPSKVPPHLAEFIVHLAGALIIFIARHHAACEGTPPAAEEAPDVLGDIE
jgi:hypothetical protein